MQSTMDPILTGFRSAKEFKHETSSQDKRLYLFGKKTNHSTDQCNTLNLETDYPLLKIPYHKVKDLSGKKRDDTFNKFKNWIMTHLPFDHSFWEDVPQLKRQEMLEQLSIKLEGKCFAESKILPIYQNSTVSRLKEIKSGNLNVLNSFKLQNV